MTRSSIPFRWVSAHSRRASSRCSMNAMLQLLTRLARVRSERKRCLLATTMSGSFPSSRRAAISIAIVMQLTLTARAEADPQTIAALKSTRHDIAITVRADRPDATYRIGDPLSVRIEASADASLIILSIGGSGKVSVLVPNSVDRTMRVQGNRMIEVPASNGPYAIRVQGPVGLELIKVIGTTEPIEPPGGNTALLARDLLAILEHQAVRGYAVAEVVIRVIDGARPER
jgi:hypothetical protein